MLDLQARIHLKEPNIAIRLEEEFDGADADVVHVLEECTRSGDERLVGALRQEGRGCLLNELLVAALDRAITGRDDVEVTQGVTRGLGFDVAGNLDETFDEVSGQILSVCVASEEEIKVGCRTDDADASTAATVGALEHHGVTC